MKWISAALLLCISATAFAADRMELLPLATVVKNSSIPGSDRTLKDGVVIQVMIVNKGTEEVCLPSRLIGPEVYKTDDVTRIVFSYIKDTYSNKSGTYRVIPSREAFAPITLRSGECMIIEPKVLAYELEQLGNNKIVVEVRTEGFLSERMGFTSVILKKELLYPNYAIAPSLRDF